MTEDEAKEKWCPHAVASHTDPRAGFRDGQDAKGKENGFPCIASACMAWRKVGSLASGVEAELEDLEVSIARGVKAMNAAEDRRFDKCHTRLRGLSSHQQAAE